MRSNGLRSNQLSPNRLRSDQLRPNQRCAQLNPTLNSILRSNQFYAQISSALKSIIRSNQSALKSLVTGLCRQFVIHGVRCVNRLLYTGSVAKTVRNTHGPLCRTFLTHALFIEKVIICSVLYSQDFRVIRGDERFCVSRFGLRDGLTRFARQVRPQTSDRHLRLLSRAVDATCFRWFLGHLSLL